MSNSMSNFIHDLRSKGITVNSSHHTKSIEPVYTLNHVWKIDNYTFRHDKKLRLKTPLFVADGNHNCRWCLTMERLSSVRYENVMGVFLHLDSSSIWEKAFVNYRFCIINDELEKAEECEDRTTREFNRGGKGWGFSNYISSDELYDPKLIPNDELTIYCEATFSESEDFLRTTNEFDWSPIQQQPDRPPRCVTKDICDLFENQKFTDVTISVNGKNFRAHKLILAARSPVFAAMFEHDTKENVNSLVEIVDIDENVVEEMLNYIYTDKCENLKDLAGGLLAAADKYDLEWLKTACEETLMNNLGVQNAAETLNLVYLHCATELKSKTIDFIIANSLEIMNSPDWDKIAVSYPKSLTLEILEAVSRQAAVSFY